MGGGASRKSVRVRELSALSQRNRNGLHLPAGVRPHVLDRNQGQEDDEPNGIRQYEDEEKGAPR